MSAKSIQILDTTLREGEQTPGVSFTIDQKVKIVEMLCDFGVDFIELGPVSYTHLTLPTKA